MRMRSSELVQSGIRRDLYLTNKHVAMGACPCLSYNLCTGLKDMRKRYGSTISVNKAPYPEHCQKVKVAPDLSGVPYNVPNSVGSE